MFVRRVVVVCIKQAVLGSIPGGDQIFLILYCLNSLWKRKNTSNKEKKAEKEIVELDLI